MTRGAFFTLLAGAAVGVGMTLITQAIFFPHVNAPNSQDVLQGKVATSPSDEPIERSTLTDQNPAFNPDEAGAIEIAMSVDPDIETRRLALVAAFDEPPNAEELERWIKYIREPIDATLTSEQILSEISIRNNVLNRLTDNGLGIVDVAQSLVTVLEDSGFPEGYRGYAAQHLASSRVWLERDNSAKHTELCQRIEASLWSAAERPQEHVAGTALVSLRHIEENAADFDSKKLQELAELTAADPVASSTARATGLALSVEYNPATALRISKNVVRHDLGDPLLARAAFAVLERHGEREAFALLHEINTERNKNMRQEIMNALRAIETRLPPKPRIQFGNDSK